MKKQQKETANAGRISPKASTNFEIYSDMTKYELGPSLYTEDLAERVAIKVDSGIKEAEAIRQTMDGV